MRYLFQLGDMALRVSIAVAAAALALVNQAQGWVVELPPCLAPFKPFVYSGCFKDSAPGGLPLLDWRTQLDQNNMTVEKCMAECKGRLSANLAPSRATCTRRGQAGWC